MASYAVTTLSDENDGGVGGSGLSLREALALANADTTTADTITFDASLAGGATPADNGVVVLTQGELVVSSDVAIDGDVDGDDRADITIDGNDSSRVLSLLGGTSTFDALTVTNGLANGFGGAMFAASGIDVTILNSTLLGNRANGGGGAIFNDGTVRIANSTISGNVSEVAGGGIVNRGTLVLNNVTLANNLATPVPDPAPSLAEMSASTLGDRYFAGGGLYNAGTATLNNSTVTGNYADYGGAIFTGPPGGSDPSQFTLNNTIVAGNTAFGGPDLYVDSGAMVYLGVNVFSQAGVGRSGFDVFEPDPANIFAAIDSVSDGGLLADNSGPVRTVAILVGGAAHNAGDNASLADDTEDLDGDSDTGEDLPLDARGRDRVFDGTVDVGAFEIQDGPPGGNTAGGSIIYFEDDAAEALDPALTASDPGGFLSAARIAISGNFAPGQDVLGFVDQSGITGAFDAATGVLTLAGLATDVQYQAALRTVTYSNTSQNPSDAPRTVNFQVDDGGGPVDLGDVGVNVIPVLDPPNDVNRDHTSDIVWRSDDGTVALWEMDGVDVLSAQAIATLPNRWLIADADGDFNGDGTSDILWRDNAGTVVLWEMDGPSIISNTAVTGTDAVGAIPDYWRIEDTGDFNGDGRADILWRDEAGRVVLWQMDGPTIVDNALVADVATTSQIEDTADFTGDGRNDILWRDQDGTVRLWEMNGPNVVADTVIGMLPEQWHFAGSGDFNGDARFDILWRDTNGTVVLWEMDGPAILTNTGLGTLPDFWDIADTGDYTGDLNHDILWRDTAGTIVLWEMNGPNILDDSAVNTVATNWQIVA
jgi:hypothetical protein